MSRNLWTTLMLSLLMPAGSWAAETTPAPQPATDPESGAAVALAEPLTRAVSELQDEAMASDEAWSLLTSLTTEVGPRLAGSTGDRAAVAWAMDRLRVIGFRQVRAESVEVPHWVRGETRVEVVEPFPQPLVAVTLGGSIGTPDAGIEAPVLALDDLEDLEPLEPGAVAGHIVYLGGRMERSQDGSGYGVAVQKRVYGVQRAAEKGAVAVVIRSAGTSSRRIAHTGATRYDEKIRKIPAFALSNPDADLLEEQVASGRPVSLRLFSSARHLEPERSANVVAEFPGRGPLRDEIVLLGAHLDSWDLGTGAHDDGAGVAIVMDAARLIMESAPDARRTLRVVLYANEEFGLDGARAYVEAHADEVDAHTLALEADLGAGQVFRVDTGVDPSDLPLAHAMISTVEPLGIQIGGNGSKGGADIGQLFLEGVPVLGPRQDASVYFDLHHTDDDTLAMVDSEHLRQNVAVYASLAYLALVIEDGFQRVPEDMREE